jgi:perosamine synthetase
MREHGYKYKMSNLQAALGCAQISRIDELVEKKRQIFNWYAALLAAVPGQLNPELPGTKNSYWLPTMVFDKALQFDREAFFILMKENGIDSRPFFFPLTSLPMFEEKKSNEVAYDIYDRAINLPSFHDITESQVKRVTELIIKYLSLHGN